MDWDVTGQLMLLGPPLHLIDRRVLLVGTGIVGMHHSGHSPVVVRIGG